MYILEPSILCFTPRLDGLSCWAEHTKYHVHDTDRPLLTHPLHSAAKFGCRTKIPPPLSEGCRRLGNPVTELVGRTVAARGPSQGSQTTDVDSFLNQTVVTTRTALTVYLHTGYWILHTYLVVAYAANYPIVCMMTR